MYILVFNVQSMLLTRLGFRRWRLLTKSHMTLPQVKAAKIWCTTS